MNLTMPINTNILSTVQIIYKLLTNISEIDGSRQIEQMIKNTDIHTIIKTLELFISDIDTYYLSNRVILHCLEQIGDIICTIQKELERVETKLQYNKKLYLFSYMRSYTFFSSIERLNNYINILHIRKKLLFNVIHNSNVIEYTTFPPSKNFSSFKL